MDDSYWLLHVCHQINMVSLDGATTNEGGRSNWLILNVHVVIYGALKYPSHGVRKCTVPCAPPLPLPTIPLMTHLSQFQNHKLEDNGPFHLQCTSFSCHLIIISLSLSLPPPLPLSLSL